MYANLGLPEVGVRKLRPLEFPKTVFGFLEGGLDVFLKADFGHARERLVWRVGFEVQDLEFEVWGLKFVV